MLTIAADSVSILPDRPCVLASAYDRTPTMSVADPIEANLVVLGDGQRRALLVSIDALYAGVRLRQALEEALAPHVEPLAIMVAASHTHLSPSLDFGKPALGLPDPEHLNSVVTSVVDCAVALVEGETVNVEAAFARYRSNAAINRRRRRWLGGAEGRLVVNSVVMTPNPQATPLQHGHVMVLSDGEGQPHCVIWQLPCHPVSAPFANAISAHFPGYVRRKLREKWGDDLTVVFLQGHSGDLRPPSVAKGKGIVGGLRRVLLGEWFGSFSADEYEAWLEGVYGDLDHGIMSARLLPQGAQLDFARSELPLEAFADPVSVPSNKVVSAQRVSIGLVDLVGVSAEPVARWGTRLEEASPRGRVCVPVGCIDDAFGYAPTGTVMREGGYEGGGFCKHFELMQLRADFPLQLAALIESISSPKP